MVTANFNGLQRIYGEDVLQKIKGCEFHYRQSVIKHCHIFGNQRELFKSLAIDMLVSGTPEAYTNAHE